MNQIIKKYQKYKYKYLLSKNIIGGGDDLLTLFEKKFNEFIKTIEPNKIQSYIENYNYIKELYINIQKAQEMINKNEKSYTDSMIEKNNELFLKLNQNIIDAKSIIKNNQKLILELENDSLKLIDEFKNSISIDKRYEIEDMMDGENIDFYKVKARINIKTVKITNYRFEKLNKRPINKYNNASSDISQTELKDITERVLTILVNETYIIELFMIYDDTNLFSIDMIMPIKHIYINSILVEEIYCELNIDIESLIKKLLEIDDDQSILNFLKKDTSFDILYAIEYISNNILTLAINELSIAYLTTLITKLRLKKSDKKEILDDFIISKTKELLKSDIPQFNSKLREFNYNKENFYEYRPIKNILRNKISVSYIKKS